LSAIGPPAELFDVSVFSGRTAVRDYEQAVLLIVLAWLNSAPKYLAFALAVDSCARIARIVLRRPLVMRRLLVVPLGVV